MSNADRHGLIAKAVRDSGGATVQELAELTGASEMTIRRDLDTLAAQGVLERVRGGARSLLLRGEEPPFALRAHEAVEVKRRIAAEGALTGPLTLASLAALRFDTAVIGCCGLSAADGLTAYDLDDAAVKKAGIASARRTVVATDGGKLGRTAYAYVGPASALHTLVTDDTAAADEVAALERAGTVVKAV